MKKCAVITDKCKLRKIKSGAYCVYMGLSSPSVWFRAFKMDAGVGKNDQAYFSTACWSLKWVGSHKKYWIFWRQVCNSSTCDFYLNQTFSGRSAVRALSDVIGLLSVADNQETETRKASTSVQARSTSGGGVLPSLPSSPGCYTLE